MNSRTRKFVRGALDAALRCGCALCLALSMVVAWPCNSEQLFGTMRAFASTSTVSIANASQWNALAAEVAAGQDYTGVTVTLSADLLGSVLTPIGTEEAPFNGTFEGNNHTVRDLTITSGSTYLGLFGHVGSAGVIQNLNVDGAITLEGATEVVKYVGGLVGFCEGSLVNCSSAVDISIVSVLDGTEVEDTNCGYTFEEIGGLAGVCYQDMSACSYSGSLYIHTDATPGSEGEIGMNIGGLVGLFGGWVEYLDDEGEFVGHYAGVASVDSAATDDEVIAVASNCENNGTVLVQATSEAGLDRFGETTTTKVVNVGGIAGYSLGNIKNCTNNETVSTFTGKYSEDTQRPCNLSELQRIACGDAVGGIVGNLRSNIVCGSSSTSASGDPGLYDERTVHLYGCVNNAEVLGLHATGGISGVTGAYTLIEGCKNTGDVTGTRWNKPAIGGISGQSYGTFRFCYNTGDVMTETGAGYYAAGIVGMLYVYTNTAGNAITEAEIYSCYNVGTIWASGAYRSGSIVGENEGYVHHCVYLNGCNSTNGDSESGQNEGTISDCSGFDAASFMVKYRSITIGGVVRYLSVKSPIYILNSCAYADGWDLYFEIEDDDEAIWPELNLFAVQDPIDLTGCSGSVYDSTVTAASYTSGSVEPAPSISRVVVTINGESVTLYANSDFVIVPQTGAFNMGDGYTATIRGIGQYTGVPNVSFTYSIEAGDFSDCTVLVEGVTFNWEDQNPQTNPDASPLVLTVKEPSGTVLSADQYTYVVNPAGVSISDSGAVMVEEDDGTTVEFDPSTMTLTPTACSEANDAWETASYDDPYYVVVIANEGTNYTGVAYGVFVIDRAWIYVGRSNAEYKASWQFGNLQWGSQTWSFSKEELDMYSVDEDGNITYGMTVKYEGQSILPALVPNSEGFTLSYLGHELTEGVDYAIVYGDPDRDEGITEDEEDANLLATTVDGNPRACVTIRYVAGGNFSNYINLYMTIETVSMDECVVNVPADLSYDYTGEAIEPEGVSVTLGEVALVEGRDYELEYSNNVAVGTATCTVVGLNSVTGSYSFTYQIVGESTEEEVQPLEAFTVKSGAAAGSYKVTGTGTVTLVKSTSKKASVTVSTVKYDGVTYKVTAVGAGAFKGNKKLKKLVIGASVKTIGKQAFSGCIALKTFTVKSKVLSKVGAKAFAGCKKLKKVKVPAAKLAKYKKLLKKGGFTKKVVRG